MEFLENIQLISALHSASSGLLIPTVIILALLILVSLYSIGSLVAEALFDRKRHSVDVVSLIQRINQAEEHDFPQLIDGSSFPAAQKVNLLEFIQFLSLPEKSRVEVAKRLLAKEEKYYSRRLFVTDIAAKIAPMLGLMGTLIPLGSGLVALGSGQVDVLSQSLMVAFDTTVAGLATAAICFVISAVRRRWYDEYLSDSESVMCALLERVEILKRTRPTEDSAATSTRRNASANPADGAHVSASHAAPATLSSKGYGYE